MSPAITASMTSTGQPAWSRVVRIKSTTGVPAGSSRVTDSGGGRHPDRDFLGDVGEVEARSFKPGEPATRAGFVIP
jgi:hypothetical protein